MQLIDTKEEEQFENLILGLINNNYAFCDNFISPANNLALLNNIDQLNLLDSMTYAGVGNKTKFNKNQQIRNDKINWINQQSTNYAEIIYIKKIERFMRYLNKTCFTALTSFESHYACYEKHSFYKRHIDQFKNENGRQYSLVLYLNQNWQEHDKGLLTLYPENKKEITILPIAARLVLFKSDTMAHEVFPSPTRARKSIAAWLKN